MGRVWEWEYDSGVGGGVGVATGVAVGTIVAAAVAVAVGVVVESSPPHARAKASKRGSSIRVRTRFTCTVPKRETGQLGGPIKMFAITRSGDKDIFCQRKHPGSQ